MRNHGNTWIGISAIAAMAIAYGCASGDAADSDAPATTGDGYSKTVEPVVFANEDGEPICPVMGGVVVDTSQFEPVDYEGKRYYFCCDGCPQSFASAPENFADGKALLKSHEEDHGHDHDDHTGHDH